MALQTLLKFVRTIEDGEKKKKVQMTGKKKKKKSSGASTVDRV